MVTIVSSDQPATDSRIKDAFFIVEPDGHQLVEIGRLLDSGDLRPVVDTVLPFAQAPLAYIGMVEKKGRGKMVVAVTE
jgi:NADPH:quinone reductase-like Zn-dependent oxidoreductase